jgi:hypothetical protein
MKVSCKNGFIRIHYNQDVEAKRYFDLSDTELLRVLHSRNSKNIRNPLIFFKNDFLLMFLAGPKLKNPPASKLASDL